jgi:hypothetical protein
MKTMMAAVAASLMTVLAPGIASASVVLDTGTPTGSSALPYTLDQSNFYAAEFNLGAGQTITNVQAYITAGMDQPGATFTIALYDAPGFTGNYPSELFASQATYTADGWNGLSNLNWSPGTAGQYWVAVEVGSGDSAIGLSLPTPATGGTAPATAFASNQGNGYALGGPAIGLQVTAVPLPAAAWLLASGLLGVGALRRRSVRMTPDGIQHAR